MADHSNNEDPEYPESPREVDGVCAICNHWVTNPSDFWDNFISCTSCPQSFHKDCVSKLTENNNNDSTDSNLVEDDHSKCICTDFINTKTNEPLQCTISRAAKSLFRTEEDGYNEISYLYDEDDNAYYWHPKDIRKKQKLLTKYGKHEELSNWFDLKCISSRDVMSFLNFCCFCLQHFYSITTSLDRMERSSVSYWGLYRVTKWIRESIWNQRMSFKPVFQIVFLSNFDWLSSYRCYFWLVVQVAIIKELYVYDEPNSVPGCSILWFWREQEVLSHLYSVIEILRDHELS